MEVVVTGVGLQCAAGDEPAGLIQLLERGDSALVDHPPLEHLPGGGRAGVVSGPSLRGLLRRRKDRKLLARPAALALAAAWDAVGDWPGERAALGLFLGVGREPPDDGESEPALAAAARGGALDERLLAGPGRDRYPPLLPLKTLPNMALAHISINMGVMGENNAWAGGEAAAVHAILDGVWAVREGRCPAALVGGADSNVNLGCARDRLRMGASGPPGEAGAVLLIEPAAAAAARGARVWAELDPQISPDGHPATLGWRDAIGSCGAADGAIAVLLAVARVGAGRGDEEVLVEESGHGRVGLAVRQVAPC